MNSSRVLIVDDQIGDLQWLVDVIRKRGYEVTLATNEEDARAELDAVARGEVKYRLAIFDVMVATKDLMTLLGDGDLDERFFEDSRDTGIRLARYARRELKLRANQLRIASLSVREDEDLKESMKELGVPLFNRAAGRSESIRPYLEKHLPFRRT